MSGRLPATWILRELGSGAMAAESTRASAAMNFSLAFMEVSDLVKDFCKALQSVARDGETTGKARVMQLLARRRTDTARGAAGEVLARHMPVHSGRDCICCDAVSIILVYTD
jgi:hypothetical protein